jgi:hypothetical protein
MKNGERVMRNKECGIIFGIALVYVMSFAACNNAFEPQKANTPVKNGCGRISIRFTGEAAEPDMARTALPLKFFDKYVYTFTKAGEETGAEKTPTAGASLPWKSAVTRPK